jgi:GrpB-like predicted nucleotidyltransferase (UPF0157 family)
MKRAPVELSEHNPEWLSNFEVEKDFLLKIIGKWLRGSVEHIGSTSVPGLIAKPVIDIMFGVESLDTSRPVIDVLVRNGYEYFPYKDDVMHWFCKPSDAFRTHHLHLIPYESTLWQERIQFREILLSNQEIANKYSALKKKLASRYKDDREAYTQEKGPFIKKCLKGQQITNK